MARHRPARWALAAAARLKHSLWASGGSLGQRAARGSAWAFLNYGGVRLLAVVRSIILARLLLPSDFGLVGMASVATGFLAVWTEVGMAPALIHRRDAEGDVLDTAWLIQAARALLLCAVTFLSAGLFAAFFKAPALAPILRVMSLSFVGYGLTSAGLVLLKKELEFRTLAYLEVATEVLSLVVAVVAAVVLRNAWALVIATLVKVFLVLAGSYLIHPYRPRLRWNPEAAKGLLNYGKYIFGGTIVNYFQTQGDSALVGRLLGVAPLGFYGLAINLANMPSTSLGNVIGQVAFPAYAKLQEDRPALVQAYVRVLQVTSVLSIPALGGIAVLAPDLVRVLYGEKWMPMAVPLAILCVAGLERAVTSPVVAAFNALGKPKTVFFLALMKLGLFAAAIYPLTMRFGITGTAIAGAAVSVVVFAYGMPLVARLLGCRVSLLLRPLTGPAAATVVMIGVLALAKLPVPHEPTAFSLGALVLVGVLAYFSTLYAIDRSAVRALRSVLALQTRPADPAPHAAAVPDGSVQPGQGGSQGEAGPAGRPDSA